MAMNTSATYPFTPNVSWSTVSGSNTAKDGTGAVSTVYTAGTNGSWVQSIKLRSLGNCTASVVRFFINNGSTNATASNNSLVYEYTTPTTTITEVAAQDDQQVDVGWVLPAGYKINSTIGTTVSGGWQITIFGRDF